MPVNTAQGQQMLERLRHTVRGLNSKPPTFFPLRSACSMASGTPHSAVALLLAQTGALTLPQLRPVAGWDKPVPNSLYCRTVPSKQFGVGRLFLTFVEVKSGAEQSKMAAGEGSEAGQGSRVTVPG